MDNLTLIGTHCLIMLEFFLRCLASRVMDDQCMVGLNVGELKTICGTDTLDLNNLMVCVSVLKHAHYKGHKVFAKLVLNVEADLSDADCGICICQFNREYCDIFAELERKALRIARHQKRTLSRKGH